MRKIGFKRVFTAALVGASLVGSNSTPVQAKPARNCEITVRMVHGLQKLEVAFPLDDYFGPIARQNVIRSYWSTKIDGKLSGLSQVPHASHLWVDPDKKVQEAWVNVFTTWGGLLPCHKQF